jgi:hypothetical protein
VLYYILAAGLLLWAYWEIRDMIQEKMKGKFR